jgi:hypothetical protein
LPISRAIHVLEAQIEISCERKADKYKERGLSGGCQGDTLYTMNVPLIDLVVMISSWTVLFPSLTSGDQVEQLNHVRTAKGISEVEDESKDRIKSQEDAVTVNRKKSAEEDGR